MLSTAQYVEKLYKETSDDNIKDATRDLVEAFNKGEKRVVIVDEEDAEKDIHYSVINN